MTLAYCDGEDEALVTLVVKKFREHVSSFLGRTAIQKLCYFCQELGVPFSYRFSMYHYGPYSDELSSAIDFMLADRVLVDRSADRQRYSNFELGSRAGELLDKYMPVVQRWDELVESVAVALGDFRPETLELMATLRFVHQRLKAAGNASPSKEEVMREFVDEKGDKFEPSAVAAVYDALKDAGLLS